MSAPIEKSRLWLGRVMSALPVLFLLFDGVAKLFKPPIVVETTVQLGYRENVIVPLGVVLTLCVIVYIIPRTAALGAVLLTGYLGGAVATHVRAGGPPFSILFPAIVGALLWGGLYLTDGRLPSFIPLLSEPPATSTKMLWAGRILSGLAALMLVFSGVMKLMKSAAVLQEFARLGYQEQTVFGIGILELACVIIYLSPRTAMLGAILLTGYLGGAVATHVRIADPFIPPLIGGVLVWAGLYLRYERLRELIPLRKSVGQ